MIAFIKNVKIKNYKCFENLNNKKGITFSVPENNKRGSGLNIFIGENNTGKTTLMSIFTKLKENSFIFDEEKYKNGDVRIILQDSYKRKKGLKGLKIIKNLSGSINIDQDSNLTKDFKISYNDIDIIKDNRIWTSNFSGGGNYNFNSYQSSYSFKRQDIDSSLASLLSTIEKSNDGKKEKLNEYMKKIIPDFLDWKIRGTSKQGNYISYKLPNNEILDIDFALGSGILNVFRIVVSLVENKKIIFIDEPEAFLHPTAQLNLLQILLDKSVNTQIFISTHSPFMFKNVFSSEARLFVCKRTQQGNIEIKNAKEVGWGSFPWSPSWGEINYYAYNLPTIELHDELYGFLHQKYIDSVTDEQEAKKRSYLDEFDDYLKTKTTQTRKWIPEQGWTTRAGENVTLQTFIRNKIHHPENKTMQNFVFSDEELRQSIDEMIKIV